MSDAFEKITHFFKRSLAFTVSGAPRTSHVDWFDQDLSTPGERHASFAVGYLKKDVLLSSAFVVEELGKHTESNPVVLASYCEFLNGDSAEDNYYMLVGDLEHSPPWALAFTGHFSEQEKRNGVSVGFTLMEGIDAIENKRQQMHRDEVERVAENTAMRLSVSAKEDLEAITMFMACLRRSPALSAQMAQWDAQQLNDRLEDGTSLVASPVSRPPHRL